MAVAWLADAQLAELRLARRQTLAERGHFGLEAAECCAELFDFVPRGHPRGEHGLLEAAELSLAGGCLPFQRRLLRLQLEDLAAARRSAAHGRLIERSRVLVW